MNQRRPFKKQYFNHQPQDITYQDGDPNVEMPLAQYAQPIFYPTHGFNYYGLPALFPHDSVYSNPADHWSTQSLTYDLTQTDYTSQNLNNPSTNVEIKSIFSPEAPEFVSKQFTVPGQIQTEVPSQQANKKKKQKKKKKKSVTVSEMCPTVDKNSGIPPEIEDSLNPTDDKGQKESPRNQAAKIVKSVRFQESISEKQEPTILPDKKKTKQQQSTTSKDPVKESVWPGLAAVEMQSVDSSISIKQTKMSFADKLKTPTPKLQNNNKSPFLDWRDQRTNVAPVANSTTSKSNSQKIQNTDTKRQASIEVKPATDDGFVTVLRRKAKDIKKNETESKEPQQQPVLPNATKKEAENDEKKKLDRQRKKLREKEKKKRTREEKILAEKLAPKGQKVTVITPKFMEKYLLSGRPASSSNKPVIQLNEDMFPALGKRQGGMNKGNVSESESEWETTEVEVVPKQETPIQKNVKRTDPIQFDLMALITKKTTKKKPALDTSKRNKTRPGLVANVLDRSAPTLSRGKIRNKKRKLSEIRKALLAAKAKKKAAQDLKSISAPSTRTRPHLLHSKKFREYCDQMLTDEIDLLSRDMLYHLRTFQDRVYKKDPIKAKMKKRLVAGLREVTKQVERNRIKIIFLAPDIQRCPETGGLDEAVQRLLDTARRMDLPIVYALSRRKIGRVLLKKVPVSCCGILNYQATEETWKKLTEAVTIARENYQLKLQQLGLTTDPSGSKPTDEIPKEDNLPVQPQNVVKEPSQTSVLLDLVKLSLTEKK